MFIVMAGEIDTSKRKPRQIRGTPSNLFSKRLSLITIGIGVGLGILFSFSPISQDFKSKGKTFFMQPTQEEIDRRFLMSIIPQRKSYEIDAIRKEQKEMYSER